MNRIYLENHDCFKLLLAYSPHSGSFEELERSMLPADVALWRGYYVNIGECICGYYATTEGPIFFCNEKRYLLTEQKYTAEVEIGIGGNVFMLKYDGTPCVEIKYPSIKYKDYDNWSDDLTVDFFLWIADALLVHRRTQFIQANTVSG